MSFRPRIRAMTFVAAVALSSATVNVSSAQTATPPASLAADPAAYALLLRYQSANDPLTAQRAFDELKALAASSPRAAYLCGVLATQQGSVVADRTVAERCLETAARAGIPEAQHRLAVLLLGGPERSDPASLARARRWLTSAADALPESVYLLALLEADHAADAERARREVVEKAATLGYPPAQFELARRLHAEGSTASKAEARAWLEKAATQGHGEAAAELALLIEGDRREQDIPRIVALLEAGSKAGSARADYALATRLLDAKGVKRDTERAFELFRRAASQGNVQAMYAIGYALGQGVGVGSDEAAAVAWFRRAADRGHAEAMYALGNSYANGWGVGKSMDLAYRWYCKAAQAGSVAGLEMIKRAPKVDCAVEPGVVR